MNIRLFLKRNTCIRSSKAGQSGSATVEAAIVLPLIMIAFMAVLSIVRVAITYERMQQAVNQVAAGMSQYSYLYSVSGLKEKHDNLNNDIEDAIGELTEQQNVITTFFGQLQNVTQDASQIADPDGDVTEAIFSTIENLQNTTDSYEDLTQQIENIIMDPMEEMRLIGLALSGSLFSEGKTMLLGSISKSMIKRNLARDMQVPASEVDDRLRLCEGTNNLDFSCSTFFDDNETIDLIVEYTVKPVPDFIFFPEIRLRNRACVLAWTFGDEKPSDSDEQENNEGDTIWNIDKSKNARSQHFGRGNKVDKWYAEELQKSIDGNSEITPYHFKTVDLIKYSENGKDGALYTIFSLNPFMPSYKKKSAIVGVIKQNMYKLSEFKKCELRNFVIDISGYEKHYKRIVYVIIPENSTLPEVYTEAYEECLGIADKLGMELRHVQKYGEYEEAEVDAGEPEDADEAEDTDECGDADK